jgi:hypothetical protein
MMYVLLFNISNRKKAHGLICSITFQKEERKGEVLSVIDMFKVTHNSKKDGYSKPVMHFAVQFLSHILL